jgi:hypothetical protein
MVIDTTQKDEFEANSVSNTVDTNTVINNYMDVDNNVSVVDVTNSLSPDGSADVSVGPSASVIDGASVIGTSITGVSTIDGVSVIHSASAIGTSVDINMVKTVDDNNTVNDINEGNASTDLKNDNIIDSVTLIKTENIENETENIENKTENIVIDIHDSNENYGNDTVTVKEEGENAYICV